MKLVGSPGTHIPPGATNTWVVRQRVKFQHMLDSLASVAPPGLAGCRLEFRTNGHATSWHDLHQWLQAAMHQVLVRVEVISLLPAQVLHACRHALAAASEAGVFSVSEANGGLPLAGWRRRSFYRLLHVCGITLPTSMRMARQLEVQGAGWGDPAQPVPAVPAGAEVPLVANPVLPAGIPIIAVPDDATPAQIRLLGQEHVGMVDWLRLAHFLQCPSLADTLHDACLHTKWRKCPRGQGRVVQFTATYLARGGMCGPLGPHLVLATINLVAAGKHMRVQRQ